MKALDPLYLVKAFDRTPPCAWFAMATESSRGRGTRRLSIRELVARSGTPKRTLVKAFYKITAGNLTLEQISRLSAACGVNLLSRNPFYYFQRHHNTGDTEYLSPNQKRKLAAALAQWEKRQAQLNGSK